MRFPFFVLAPVFVFMCTVFERHFSFCFFFSLNRWRCLCYRMILLRFIHLFIFYFFKFLFVDVIVSVDINVVRLGVAVHIFCFHLFLFSNFSFFHFFCLRSYFCLFFLAEFLEGANLSTSGYQLKMNVWYLFNFFSRVLVFGQEATNYTKQDLFGLVCWVLWHINLCRLFNAKSIFM